jgi:hypothetical protein
VWVHGVALALCVGAWFVLYLTSGVVVSCLRLMRVCEHQSEYKQAQERGRDILKWEQGCSLFKSGFISFL